MRANCAAIAMDGFITWTAPAGTILGTYISIFPYVFFGTTPFSTGGGTYNSVCDSEYNAVVETSSSFSSISSSEEGGALRCLVFDAVTVCLIGCSPCLMMRPLRNHSRAV